MADAFLDDLDRRVAAQTLFGSCAASLDPQTDEYLLKRVFYVAVFAEAQTPEAEETLGDTFEELLADVRALIAASGASVVLELGPDYGSRLQLIFASSDDYVLGGTFRDRLATLRNGLKPIVSRAKRGIVIGMIVGNGAITAAGGPQEAARVFELPQPVVELIYQANNAGTTAVGVRNVLFKKREEEEPADETTPQTKPRLRLNLGGQHIDFDS